MASAWATLVAYGSMMLLSWVVGKKYYPVPYNLRKSGIYLLSSIAIALISFTVFRENYGVSISLLIVFGFIIYWNERSTIVSLIKQKRQ